MENVNKFVQKNGFACDLYNNENTKENPGKPKN